MKSKHKYRWIYVLAGLLTSACTDGTFLHEYRDVDLWGWDGNDTVAFDLPVITASGEVEAIVGVRHTISYTYKDIVLLGTVERDGANVQTDTIRVSIYKANGTNEGDGFPYITTEQIAVTFPVDSGHTYRYTISHLAIRERTKGITGIGLRLKTKGK